jgi:hypothetical protein
MRTLFIACASACLLSCSALGLDDYDVFECDPGQRCELLNAALDGECLQYTCSPSGRGCELTAYDGDYDGHPSRVLCADEPDIAELDCDDETNRRYPDLAETCDGLDNDCNTFIDEGVVPEELVIDEELEEGTEQISVVSSGDLPPLLAVTRFDGASHITQSWRVHERTLEDPKLLAFNSVDDDRLTEVCSSEEHSAPCRIKQLAIGASNDTLLGVAVQRSGQCGEGQLRAGTGTLSDALLDLNASATDSNVRFGIDVDPMQDYCTRSGECVGAENPALGMLGRAGEHVEQALAAWHAPSASACEEACACPGAFQIMGLGLFADVDDDDRRYASGTHAGHAEPIGNGDATGVPAIAAFESSERDSGYFLAYPAGDRIELRFIPRFDQRDTITKGALEGRIDADDALHVAVSERLFAAADPAEPHGLAVAFVEADNALRFAPLSLDRDERNAAFTALAEPLQLPTQGNLVTRPLLLYAPDGFTADDASGSHGGWLVLWLEEAAGMQTLRAVRIAEAELRVLGEPLELARGPVGYPFVFLKQASGKPSVLRYGFVRDDTLRVSRITCDPDN